MGKIDVKLRNKLIELGVWQLLKSFTSDDLSRLYAVLISNNCVNRKNMSFSQGMYEDYLSDKELIQEVHMILCTNITTGDVVVCDIVWKLMKVLHPKCVFAYRDLVNNGGPVHNDIITFDDFDYGVRFNLSTIGIIYICYLVQRKSITPFLETVIEEAKPAIQYFYKKFSNDFVIKSMDDHPTISHPSNTDIDQISLDMDKSKVSSRVLIDDAIRLMNSHVVAGNRFGNMLFAVYSVEPQRKRLTYTWEFFENMAKARNFLLAEREDDSISFEDYYLLGLLFLYDSYVNNRFRALELQKPKLKQALDSMIYTKPVVDEKEEKRKENELQDLKSEVERLKIKGAKYDELLVKYNDSQNDMNRWKTKYLTSQESNAARENVQSAYENLKDKYSDLEAKYAELQESYKELKEAMSNDVDILSIEELTNNVKDFRVLVIGGYDNTTIRLKKLFSNWTFIDSEKYTSSDATMVNNHELLVVLSSYNSHKCTLKFTSVAEKHNIPCIVTRSTNTNLVLQDINNYLNS